MFYFKKFRVELIGVLKGFFIHFVIHLKR